VSDTPKITDPKYLDFMREFAEKLQQYGIDASDPHSPAGVFAQAATQAATHAAEIQEELIEHLMRPSPSVLKLREAVEKLRETVVRESLPTAEDIIKALIPHPQLLFDLKVALHEIPVLSPWTENSDHRGVRWCREDANGVRVCKAEELFSGSCSWEVRVPKAADQVSTISMVIQNSKKDAEAPKTIQEAMAQADMAVMSIAPHTLFQDSKDYPGNVPEIPEE